MTVMPNQLSRFSPAESSYTSRNWSQYSKIPNRTIDSLPPARRPSAVSNSSRRFARFRSSRARWLSCTCRVLTIVSPITSATRPFMSHHPIERQGAIASPASKADGNRKMAVSHMTIDEWYQPKWSGPLHFHLECIKLASLVNSCTTRRTVLGGKQYLHQVARHARCPLRQIPKPPRQRPQDAALTGRRSLPRRLHRRRP